jgi:CRISPR-associated endonuclease Cas3-HD
VVEWLPLHQHLADAAGVAGRLLDEWVSPLVVARLARDLGDAAAVRTVVTWLAAVHDVGKISPAFVVQVDRLADAMRDHGLAADPRLARDPDRSRVRHEVVGQLAVRRWLHEELGFRPAGICRAAGLRRRCPPRGPAR